VCCRSSESSLLYADFICPKAGTRRQKYFSQSAFSSSRQYTVVCETEEASPQRSQFPRPVPPVPPPNQKISVNQEGDVYVGDFTSRQLNQRIETVQELLRKTKKLFEDGKYEEVIVDMKNALQLIPTRSELGGECSVYLGMAYQTLRMDSEARSVFLGLQVHPVRKVNRFAADMLDVLRGPIVLREPESFDVFRFKNMNEMLDSETWVSGDLRRRSEVQERIQAQVEKEQKALEQYLSTLDPRAGPNFAILLVFTSAFILTLAIALSQSS